MNTYATEIRAINPVTNELLTWSGPNIPGISFSDAEQYCQNNGLGYCKVIGLLLEEIPCKQGTLEPDWSNKVDYQKHKLN